MLRALVLLLVVANLMFFGWSRGWFEPAWPAPGHGEREPERRAAQFRPELVTVLSPNSASAALSAAKAARPALGEGEACLEAGPFSDAEIIAAEAALNQALPSAGSAVRSDRTLALPTSGPQYWLRAERADRALQEQLRGLKVAAFGGGFGACREGR